MRNVKLTVALLLLTPSITVLAGGQSYSTNNPRMYVNTPPASYPQDVTIIYGNTRVHSITTGKEPFNPAKVSNQQANNPNINVDVIWQRNQRYQPNPPLPPGPPIPPYYKKK